MVLFIASYLKSVAKSAFDYNKAKTRIINENRSSFPQIDVFLSHTYGDKKVIRGLFIELLSFGLIVYVDWIIDPHLDRSSVDKSTASLIRKRMRQSKSLIYATSDNASVSKWMQWELGFMDGYNKERCTILPISDSSKENFRGREFLSLYPYLNMKFDIYEQSESPFGSPSFKSSLRNWMK